MLVTVRKNLTRNSLGIKENLLRFRTILEWNCFVHVKFGTRKKKIVELSSEKVKVEFEQKQQLGHKHGQQIKSYLQMRKKIESIPWETMQFHKLCSLQKEVIDSLEIELKKDKFNITDQEFIANQLGKGHQLPLKTYHHLDRHYKKIYSLLKNTNDFYDQFPSTQQHKQRYLHEIYVTDLINDQELNLTIGKFIKNISRPQKLQGYTEPSFVKYLLAAKRELLLQGIHFETKAQLKQTKIKNEQIIESIQKQHLPKIKILQILNYEYQFWQDVKHNRAKNGSEENFLIQTRQISNPNQSLILRDLYPTMKIKYIARHKSLKETQRCFCIKAELLIQVEDKLKRKIKVQWKGPSNSRLQSSKPATKTSQEKRNEEQVQKVNYLVIDYEDIYDGNPTIKPIFYF